MRRFMIFLPIVALLAGVAAPAVQAAPSDAKMIVSGKAQLVGTAINVSVTYICPASFTSGLIAVFVSQAETGASGVGFMSAPCTDDRETLLVPVAGTFALGHALVQGFISGTFVGDSDVRRIQIVQ